MMGDEMHIAMYCVAQEREKLMIEVDEGDKWQTI